MQTVTVHILTDSAGDAISYSNIKVSGSVVHVFRDIGDLASGAVDLTVTSEDSAQAIYSATNASGDAVAESTGVGGVILFHERIKVVTAQGGDTKSGVLRFAVNAEDTLVRT